MTAMERYEAALAGQAVDRLPCHPITMMFASRLIGRTYHDYVTDHRVLVEGQMAVCETFGVDALQVISDPCREVHDLGGECVYFEDEAPACDARNALLRDKTVLNRLTPPDPLGGGRMHDRVNAVALFREKAGPDVSVQGWVEGPVAMGVDMRGMQSMMMDLVDDPGFCRDVFAFNTEMEIAFARAQVEAGADTIGVGDAAASLVSATAYRELAFEYEKQLVDAIGALGAKVRLHVCGNTTHLTEAFEALGVDYFDVDYPCDLAHARATMPTTALLGNMEPARYLLRGTPDEVYEKIADCHRIVGPKFIVGAGCEVPKEAPHGNLHALCRYAREHGTLQAVGG